MSNNIPEKQGEDHRPPAGWLDELPAETGPFGVIPKHVLKGEGIQCHNCGKYAKARAQVIDRTMARGLILMAGKLGRNYPGGWVHFPTLPRFLLRSNTLSQTRHWRLIEARKQAGKNPMFRGSGYWRLTADGMRFVLGNVSVMKTAWVYNDHVLEFEGPPVTICESLGRKFNYETLLHESGYRGH